MQPSRDIARLIEIVAALRHPQSGCAWDKEQSFETIAPYAIEEAYEMADAVGRNDMRDLKEELGDLLFQVVFQSRIAEERGYFDLGGVVEAITQKMIDRHPHVFGNRCHLAPEERKSLWDAFKTAEKAAKKLARKETAGANSAGDGELQCGLLGDVPIALPGLTRAVKLQAIAATVGFDWNDARLVLEKICEETAELETALEQGKPREIEEEIGDVLFALANLARHVQVDPEAALRRANGRFERRFRFIENELARKGKTPAEVELEEMEALWNVAKQCEVQSPDVEQHEVPAGSRHSS
jgi:nucleoside triphosphate diphosphatase